MEATGPVYRRDPLDRSEPVAYSHSRTAERWFMVSDFARPITRRGFF
jgi:hypothetical protein